MDLESFGELTPRQIEYLLIACDQHEHEERSVQVMCAGGKEPKRFRNPLEGAPKSGFTYEQNVVKR